MLNKHSIIIRFVHALTSLSARTAMLALATIVVAYTFEVVSRYFFASPTLWASDLVGLLLFLSLFLMLPEITRSYGHVKIDFLDARLSDAARLNMHRFVSLVCAIVCLIVAMVCVTEIIRQFSFDVTTVSVYPLPKWLLSSCMTFGFLLSGVQFALQGTSTLTPIEGKDEARRGQFS